MRALNIFFNVDNKQQSVLSEQHLTYFQENDILENINDRVGWYEIKPQYIEQFLLYFDGFAKEATMRWKNAKSTKGPDLIFW